LFTNLKSYRERVDKGGLKLVSAEVGKESVRIKLMIFFMGKGEQLGVKVTI